MMLDVHEWENRIVDMQTLKIGKLYNVGLINHGKVWEISDWIADGDGVKLDAVLMLLEIFRPLGYEGPPFFKALSGDRMITLSNKHLVFLTPKLPQ